MDDIVLELKDIEARKGILYPHIRVGRGEIVFITGESGVGKSTLFQICNGMLTPNKGEVFFEGQNIYDLDPLMVRRNILLLGQEVFLFPGTVEENFKTFYEYRDEACPSMEKIQEYLAICNVQSGLDCDCSDLSGGERQRIYIAIFLSFTPKIFLLDEPTASLDAKNAQAVMGNIVRWAKDHTIGLLIISHTEDLLCHGDRVIHLERE